MIIPDANLLLYAYDAESTFHEQARSWCERVLSGPEPVTLLPAVIFGFMRIATHPKVFANPLSAAEAADHVASWLAQPHVKVVDMLAEDVECALALLRGASVAGNLTTDAQIAAVAMRLGADIYTADLDFGRFPGVRYTNPL